MNRKKVMGSLRPPGTPRVCAAEPQNPPCPPPPSQGCERPKSGSLLLGLGLFILPHTGSGVTPSSHMCGFISTAHWHFFCSHDPWCQCTAPDSEGGRMSQARGQSSDLYPTQTPTMRGHPCSPSWNPGAGLQLQSPGAGRCGRRCLEERWFDVFKEGRRESLRIR